MILNNTIISPLQENKNDRFTYVLLPSRLAVCVCVYVCVCVCIMYMYMYMYMYKIKIKLNSIYFQLINT